MKLEFQGENEGLREIEIRHVKVFVTVHVFVFEFFLEAKVNCCEIENLEREII